MDLVELKSMSISKLSTMAQEMKIKGTRRPMRMIVRDTDVAAGVDEHGPYVQLSFALPPGSYATIVLREIMKNDRADVDDASD